MHAASLPAYPLRCLDSCCLCCHDSHSLSCLVSHTLVLPAGRPPTRTLVLRRPKLLPDYGIACDGWDMTLLRQPW
jgi:hypothetical protein